MYEEYFKYVNQEVTEDIKKFVDDEVFRNEEYIFVKKENEINKGFCTKCFKEFDMYDIEHNRKGKCPSCGADITIKLSRYGRKNCTNEACFYYFEKSPIDPQVIICKGYYVYRSYEDYKNPKTEYDLQAVYIFHDKETVMLKKYWNYYYDPEPTWELRNSVFDFDIDWLGNMECYCSFESIRKAIRGTSFQHIPYKTFIKDLSMVKLFDEYAKHPVIEYLVKEGFSSLVEEKIDGCQTHRAVNWNGKSIFKILKISKVDLRELKTQKVRMSFNFLKTFQDCKKRNWNLSIDEQIRLAEEYWPYYEELIELTKYSSIKKILNYFLKQYTKFNGELRHQNYYDESAVLITFKDYLKSCKKLGMDINREQVLFPKDLYKAHQNTLKQIKIKENKKYDEMINKRIKSLEKYLFQDEKYLIRPAISSLDIIEEGSQLNHCVATHYLIPYAKGQTDILLVRKVMEPDKPFCTVEVKDNEVKQAYIKNDRIPPKETMDFIEKFKKAKLTKRKRVKLSA